MAQNILALFADDITHAQHIPLIQIKEKNVMSCAKILSKVSVLLITSGFMSLGLASSEVGGNNPLDGERSGGSGLHATKATQANYNDLFERLYSTENPTKELTTEERDAVNHEFSSFFQKYQNEGELVSAMKYVEWSLGKSIFNKEEKKPAWHSQFYQFIKENSPIISSTEDPPLTQRATNLKRLRDQPALITPRMTLPDFTIPDIENLKSSVMQDVIGQDEAVSSITMNICDHFVALKMNQYIQEHPDEAREKGWATISKRNMLVIGESGSGKTKTFEVIDHYFNQNNTGIKIIKLNTSGLVASGYKGGYTPTAIGDIVLNTALALSKKTIHNVTSAEIESALKGIVLILDEFDKLRISGNDDSGVTNSKVQNELLPYIDEYGKELSVEREISSGKNKTFKVNTKDILFICMGAFAELTLEKNEECVITTSEIIRYGFLPEIVGRLPIIATYQPHTTDSLTRILKESRNSQVAQARTLLSAPYYNITLEFTNSAYEAIAEIAMKSKTGARSLSPIVQEIIRHIKTNKHLYQGTTLTITREIVKKYAPKTPKRIQPSYIL